MTRLRKRLQALTTHIDPAHILAADALVIGVAFTVLTFWR